MTDRQYKLFEESVNVSTDLITEQMVREELKLVLNQQSDVIEDELKREQAMNSRLESTPSYQ